MPAVHPFTLERPRSAEAVVQLLAEHGDEARVLAGGQSLTPLLTLGFSSPEVLVSLDQCSGLDTLEQANGQLHIGAMVTTARLEHAAELRVHFAVLVEAASQVGSPHVRNFGTVVGNVCHADPRSDVIVALLCHDTVIQLKATGVDRRIALEDFIDGPNSTKIEPGEMAVAVDVAVEANAGWTFGYRKVVKRAGDPAMAICAVRLRCENNYINDARVVVGGAVSLARRLTALESSLTGVHFAAGAETTLAADVLAGVESHLMPERTAPIEYLHTMLPRLVAATVGDAAGKVAS
jgi:aerobic carbon-monoxide dehydrogenase medium subunit